jgi:hypothetical protein
MRWLVILVVTVVASATASAAVAQPTQALRLGATVGLDLWPELGDLEPTLGGDFDEAGFGVELNLHYGGWSVGPARIYLGGDLGVIGNGSDVEGAVEGEDLQTTLVYVTPSVRALVGDAGETRWSLDAGIGYYDVSIEEWEDDCFWDCDTWDYYDDSSIGGYLGLGLEFPLRSEGATRLLVGLKAHFVEFDEPAALDPGGSLDGPIYVLYFGVGLYR